MRLQFKTSAFKRCVKRLARRRWNLALLAEMMNKLASDAPPSELHKDHPLAGAFVGKRECHVTSITDDWVLVYHKSGDDKIFFHATGTHSDVFGQ